MDVFYFQILRAAFAFLEFLDRHGILDVLMTPLRYTYSLRKRRHTTPVSPVTGQCFIILIAIWTTLQAPTG
jgi:hypothetical protein